jgi:sorting nexin-29
MILNDLTDHFKVNWGLIQRDGLAPLLLKTALEYAGQLSVDVYSALMYKSGEIVGYADDINIMGRSMQTVGKLHRQLEGHTKTVGRTINTTKTNVMTQSRKDLSCKHMEIQDTAAADCFTYLGTINNRK